MRCPPDADLDTVKVVPHIPSRMLPGAYELSPVPPLAPADGSTELTRIPLVKNPRVYDADEFYPPDHVRLREVGRMRSWKVAALEYWPYCYNPVTGKLRVADARSVRITFQTQPAVDLQSPDAAAADMSGFVANADQAAAWYSTAQASAASRPTSLIGPMGLIRPIGRMGHVESQTSVSDYLIITSSAIASTSARLADFCSLLGLRGFTTRILTQNEWGGGSGDEAADNIRAWLARTIHEPGVGVADAGS